VKLPGLIADPTLVGYVRRITLGRDPDIAVTRTTGALTHAVMPDEADNRAHTALRAVDKAGIDRPSQWLSAHCPAWTQYQARRPQG
jgi:hypothetical protein